MNNTAKIFMVISLATQLSACAVYGGSGFSSDKGYFDINGASSNTEITNAISASMQSSDQERLGHALSTTRNTQPFAWQNSITGYNYKLMPVRTFVDDQGEPCRAYLLTAIIKGKTMTSRATACRAGGTWQMTR
jgi:surface antigen